MPSEPFPSGNTPDEFNVNMGKLMSERTNRGNRKVAVACSILVVGLGLVIGFTFKAVA